MDPNKWGPPLWHFLHIMTFNYPDNPTSLDIQNHQMFLESLKHILPCEKCKNHYKENITNYPPKLQSKLEFIKWMIDLHNEVNKKNNKKIYSYDEAIELIKNNFEKDKVVNNTQSVVKSDNSWIKYLLVAMIAFIIGIFLCLFITKKTSKRKIVRY